MRSDAPEVLRIGQFSISLEFIWNHQNLVRIVLRDVVVIKAEVQAWMDTIQYVGIHESFAEVAKGDYGAFDIPHYSALIYSTDHGPEFNGWLRAP